MDVYDRLVPFLVAGPDVCATRRRVILAPLLATVPFALAGTVACNLLLPKTLETTQPELFAGCTQATPNALVQASSGEARLRALLGAHT
jgi:hypothetical protein